MKRSILMLLRAIRVKEASLMVGFPALGGWFALQQLSGSVIAHYSLILLGFFFLSSSVYAFNAWGGRLIDGGNVLHQDSPLHKGETAHTTVLICAILLLLISLSIFALDSFGTVVSALILWTLWFLYSHPTLQAKGKIFIGSGIHLSAGYLMFLIPYILIAGSNLRGWVLATFFSFGFVAGHANHEVMDYDADIAEGLRTNAIVFGRELVHNASLALFLLNYLFLAITCLAKVIEPWIAAPFLCLIPIHVYLHRKTKKSALTTECIRRYRNSYRFGYAIAGSIALAAHLIHIF